MMGQRDAARTALFEEPGLFSDLMTQTVLAQTQGNS